jgi:hypothetical protein
MSLELEMIDRLPAGVKKGRQQVVRDIGAASIFLKGTLKENRVDPGRTRWGQTAQVIEPNFGKEVAPAILRARRQVAYLASERDRLKTTLVTKAKGKALPTEALWIQKLMAMTPNARMAFCLENPVARAVALRQPELLDIVPTLTDQAFTFGRQRNANPTGYDLLMNRQLKEGHEAEAAQLLIEGATLDIAKTMLRELETTAVSAPVVTNVLKHFKTDASPELFPMPGSEEVRPFTGLSELNRYLASKFPTAPAEATISEKIDADFDEAA